MNKNSTDQGLAQSLGLPEHLTFPSTESTMSSTHEANKRPSRVVRGFLTMRSRSQMGIFALRVEILEPDKGPSLQESLSKCEVFVCAPPLLSSCSTVSEETQGQFPQQAYLLASAIILSGWRMRGRPGHRGSRSNLLDSAKHGPLSEA